MRELPQVGADPTQNNNMMTSLDVRIFMVTIFLSVVLLCVSVTELLCCFKIIQDVASLAEWKFLLYYLLSEQFPSITIACFFNSATGDINAGEVAHADADGFYSGGDKKKGRRSQSRAAGGAQS